VFRFHEQPPALDDSFLGIFGTKKDIAAVQGRAYTVYPIGGTKGAAGSCFPAGSGICGTTV